MSAIAARPENSPVLGLALIATGLSLFWLTVGFCVGLALSTRVLS